MARSCICGSWKKSAAHKGGLTRSCLGTDGRLCGGAQITPKYPGYYGVSVWLNRGFEHVRPEYVEASTLPEARARAHWIFKRLLERDRTASGGMSGCRCKGRR